MSGIERVGGLDAVALNRITAALAGDTALPAGTPTTLITVKLDPGTWLVIAQVSVLCGVAGTQVDVRLISSSDGLVAGATDDIVAAKEASATVFLVCQAAAGGTVTLRAQATAASTAVKLTATLADPATTVVALNIGP